MSIVYFRVYSWCAFDGFGEMYNVWCACIIVLTEYFHCPENPCAPTIQHSSIPQFLATTDLFTVAIVLLFPECLVLGIMLYTTFQTGVWSPFYKIFLFFILFFYATILF